ncbi:MAG: hypothetical protein EOO02_15755, partial [Chitinophagaceae bacterium]
NKNIDNLFTLIKDPSQLQILKNAKINSEVLLNLVKNTIDTIKIKTDKFELSYDNSNLESIIRKMFVIHSENLKTKNIFAQTLIDRNIPEDLYIDTSRLLQILINLVSNAVKFTRPGIKPQIHIAATRLAEKSFESAVDQDGPFCMIEVTDNGIGFDDKFSQSVFVLFERLNSKDSFEGTGIGLTITKKIIEKHSGIITAEGRPGSGSTFRFILPLKQ